MRQFVLLRAIILQDKKQRYTIAGRVETLALFKALVVGNRSPPPPFDKSACTLTDGHNTLLPTRNQAARTGRGQSLGNYHAQKQPNVLDGPTLQEDPERNTLLPTHSQSNNDCARIYAPRGLSPSQRAQ